MNVYPPQFQSIHAPISINLDTKFQLEPIDNEILSTIPKIKWDESKAELFRNLLNQGVNLERINHVENILKEGEISNVILEYCTREVTDILYSNASKCFTIVNKMRKKKSR